MRARHSSVAFVALSVSLFAGCAAPVPTEEVGGSSDRMTDGAPEATSRALVKDLEGETVKVLFQTRLPWWVRDPLLLGASGGNQCFLVAKEDTPAGEPDRHLERGRRLRIGAITEVFAMIGGLGRTYVTLPLEGAGADISCTLVHTRAGQSLRADDVLAFVGPRFQVGAREPAPDRTAYEPMDQPRE